MTEEEAKTKWCPFTRFAAERDDGELGPSSNRWLNWSLDGIATPACCVASACMAWREKTPAYGEMWRDGQHIPGKAADGFCGLAGQP